MRRFIIATNKQGLEITGAKVIEMDIVDLPVIFNNDCLNVMNEEDYNIQLGYKYMYGIEVEMKNYLKDYRSFLNQVYNFDSELMCIFDASIKRYINNVEIAYFANNKLLPSKLFNIEIDGRKGCKYRTLGLASIGLKEFSFETPMYLNEEDFQIFKAVVTNFVIGKQPGVYINGQKINYSISEQEDRYVFNYLRPNKIMEFYIRDDMYLNKIRYELIAHNWERFIELNKTVPEIGEYLVNKAKVYDLEGFEMLHAEEFTIVCEGINYNQDNLFYANKYL